MQLNSINSIANYKLFRNNNITLKKAFCFGVTSGIGAGIIAGGTYFLTEVMGVYYIISTVLSGGLAFLIKFIVNATWTFKE